jgi:hypothetical protein
MSFEREDDDDESDDNDGSLDLSNASSPANEREYGGDQVSQKSTSQPLKRRLTTRKKQAEEEYNLIKNLSQSVANKNKRKIHQSKMIQCSRLLDITSLRHYQS